VDGEAKGVGDMEMVFVLLAVVILVVLPIALFLLVIGDLVYCIYRAIIGDKKEVEHSTAAPSFHAR
jgi:hypothetical protein